MRIRQNLPCCNYAKQPERRSAPASGCTASARIGAVMPQVVEETLQPAARLPSSLWLKDPLEMAAPAGLDGSAKEAREFLAESRRVLGHTLCTPFAVSWLCRDPVTVPGNHVSSSADHVFGGRAGEGRCQLVTAPSEADETCRAYFAMTPLVYRGAGAVQWVRSAVSTSAESSTSSRR